MLDRLDIEPAQVFLDVKFVSTNNQDLYSLGVDYGDLGPTMSLSMGQIPVTLPFNLGSGGWEDFKTFTLPAKIDKPGTHDVLLLIERGDAKHPNALVNIDWFELGYADPPGGE